MDISNFFPRASSNERELSNHINNGDESKKPREESSVGLDVLNSSALEDVLQVV